jgi:hypothetical protein
MTFTIVQNDTAPPIGSRLADSGEPVDLSNVSNVRFHMEDRFDRVIIEDDLTGRVNIVDASAGEVEYAFTNGDTSDVGKYKGEWQVLYSDGKIETFPSAGKVDIQITEEIQ